MSLAPFIYRKKILIDDAGWGDIILGVVIGALKLPERRYMERRIPVSSFQSPNFEQKQYLEEAVKIAEEFVEVMHPDKATYFEVCSGFVLSRMQTYLKNQGFHVDKAKITGELQEKVEKGFIDWCVEVGVPREKLEIENRRRFYTLLEWVAEKIEIRENLVKTGWESWQEKWRKEAYKIYLQKKTKTREKGYT
ncbi:MAG: hypothetical protein OEX77_04440 [Candidatus Bathyarchaeota archaeon]|nr:hypothetical protein [Candidatus Bathyarchaeota archaeon]MDH5733045.1 hypothetical protein [Candidatus Bathyarchaeota archaeon]